MTKKKVILYCRKSQESEDRQVLSIQSQINELKQIAKRLNLEIVGEPMTESMSAKAPGRPIFAEVMGNLISKKADGILCWKLDRLARNAVDGGSVIWAIKSQGISIYTPSQVFSQENDNVLLMYMEFGMAQKFVDDLGKNTKRGLKAKVELGWYPCPAPIGYLNTPSKKKGLRIIEPDQKIFSIIRMAFDEILAGKQASDVFLEARDKWKLTTKEGKPIGHSTFYFLLKNPFYYGEFEYPKGSGTWYKGKHTPIISREEFDIVQKKLGKDGRPIARTHQFDLTGLFRCGHCGSAITATKKVKHYVGTDRTVTYTYYHCTRKNSAILCQEKPITEKMMQEQINEKLLSIQPPVEFINWAKKWMKVIHEKESQNQEVVLEHQQFNVLELEKKLNRLLDLRLNDSIDDQTYKEKKIDLENNLRNAKEKTEDTNHSLTNWRQKVETALDFAHAAQATFTQGSRDDKRYVLMALGSNLELTNQKVRIDLLDHFKVFSEHGKWNEKYKYSLELQKYTDLYAKMPGLKPGIPTWLPLYDEFRNKNVSISLSFTEINTAFESLNLKVLLPTYAYQ